MQTGLVNLVKFFIYKDSSEHGFVFQPSILLFMDLKYFTAPRN